MATRVIYGDPADNAVGSSSGTYATARAMAGTNTIGSVSADPIDSGITDNLAKMSAGQAFSSTIHYCAQTFLEFDTSNDSLFTGISSVTLSLFFAQIGSLFQLNARLNDWGDTVTTSSGIDGASLSANTLVAHISSFSTVSYNDFTDDALPANLNGSGLTRLVICSARQEAGTAESGGNFKVTFGSGDGGSLNGTNPPKLKIVDTSTQNSQIFSAAGSGTFNPAVIGLHDLEMWGGGARPNVASTSQQAGASAAVYVYSGNYNVTSLSAISLQVGTGGAANNTAGTDSWFASSSSPNPLAKGGVVAAATDPTGSRGTIINLGGRGAAAQAGGGSRGGSGGGGAPTAAGVGSNGAAGSSSTGGNGGNDGDGTTTNKGGNGGNSGANGNAGSGIASGGGGPGNGTGKTSGNGKDGKLVAYWYVYPASKSSPPFAAPRRFWKKRAA